MITVSQRISHLNQLQTTLRTALEATEVSPHASGLFLDLHAALHSAAVAPGTEWSLEDEVFNGLSETQIRTILPGQEHSVAWLVWHIARCEDITMNVLVAGTPQVLHHQGWYDRMGATAQDTGNAMSPGEITEVSGTLDIPALRGYRLAVGQRTQEIFNQLQPPDLRRKMDPARVRQVLEQRAVVGAARGVLEYWSKRTVTGLLLMPATRHPLTHLNEAWHMKGALQRNA